MVENRSADCQSAKEPDGCLSYESLQFQWFSGIIHNPDEPEPKKLLKNSQRIEKRPTDKTLNGNIIAEKDIEWFCLKLFNRIMLIILPKSVGRFSIRWR